MKSFLVILLSFCLSMAAQAQERYFFVSPSGDDSNTGTVQKPWRSPEAAFSKVQRFLDNNPGAKVHLFFRGGEYQLKSAIKLRNRNFKISGMKGENAVICGDLPLRNFRKLNDSIWVSDLKAEGLEDLGTVFSKDNRLDLYYGGKRQILARWPNEGFIRSGNALGETSISDGGSREGIIEYVDDRISNWISEKDACCSGYWKYDWKDGYQSIEQIDTAARILFMKQPYHLYGYRDSLRFYGTNLRCEIDMPGEYYVDRDSSVLYWYAPEDFKDGSRAYVSDFKGDYMLELDSCDGLSINNLSFRGARGGALRLNSCNDVLLSDCCFTDFGNNPIIIKDGKRNIIDRCLLQELGCGGIIVEAGDRKTLEPCGHIISNTIVRNFSLFKRTYEPAVLFRGAGMTITHNLFQGSASSAMRIEGNDVDISYNQCFDLVKESDDQGGLDMYFNYSYRGVVIRYNHWKDIRGNMAIGACAIRFDDIISGQMVYGNVIENCGGSRFGGVQINGGKSNWVRNNLFYGCPACAVSVNEWDEGIWADRRDRNMSHINEVDAFGTLYSMRYPEINEAFNLNVSKNFASDNLAVKTPCFSSSTRLQGENNTVLEGDEAEPLEYFLNADILASYGLRPIPFAEIGPKGNKYL